MKKDIDPWDVYDPWVTDVKFTWHKLHDVVRTLRYKPGWEIFLAPIQLVKNQHGQVYWQPYYAKTASPTCYRTLAINLKTVESITLEPFGIGHRFPIPMMDWTRREWEDWVWQKIIAVEIHEAAEFFEVNGEKPFYPNHDELRYPDHGVPYDIKRREVSDQ